MWSVVQTESYPSFSAYTVDATNISLLKLLPKLGRQIPNFTSSSKTRSHIMPPSVRE
jgi:hypothetical protein